MLRRRTVKDQLLPVLENISANLSNGLPIPQACQKACHDVSKRLGISYQTIEDLCRRRLGLDDIGQFHALIRLWIDNDSKEIERLLKQQSVSAAHHLIDQFFAESTGHATSTRDRSFDVDRGRDGRSLTVENLDGETLAVLAERARARGKSVESEARDILDRVVREGREDFASWTQHLRAKLRESYSGDVTADIRADRDR